MTSEPAAPHKTKTQHVHTLVIGAGASGLFCAMQLGHQFKAAGKEDTVLVIDHANKAGKKIIMSGGGKCNFTNYSVEPENYISNNAHFCKSALSRYLNWDFIALVEKHGIAYEERKHGQLFCLKSSKDILSMLLAECALADVTIQLKTTVSSIQTHTAGFEVLTSHGTIKCKHLVIATGGLSIPSIGATGFGYEVAEQFGHVITPKQAGLVPFMFTDDTGKLTQTLSGNAIDVTATINNISFTEAMLFTHRGLSGPAMLQISNYWRSGDTFCVDLKPEIDFETWLVQQKTQKPKSLIRSILGMHFPKNLVQELQNRLWHPYAEKPLADIPNQSLMKLGHTLNNWQLKPASTEGYRKAEVTLGGVCVKHISSKTMQSTLQPNLYFIGEVLDVTGWLGGYNFQWAWASAFVCAEHLSKH